MERERGGITVAVPPVAGQLEARGAATLVGPRSVFALVSAEAAVVVPALVDIYSTKPRRFRTTFGDGLGGAWRGFAIPRAAEEDVAYPRTDG